MPTNIDNNNLWISIPGASNDKKINGLNETFFRLKEITLESKSAFTTTNGTYTTQGGNNKIEISFNDRTSVNITLQNLITKTGGIIADPIVIVQGYESQDKFIIENKFTIGDANNPIHLNLGQEGCLNNEWFSNYLLVSSVINYEFGVIDAEGSKEGSLNGRVGETAN